ETQWKFITYSAERGLIYDANGYQLASNAYDYTIVCTPKNVVSNADKKEDRVTREQIIDSFVAIIGVDREKMEDVLPVDPEDTSDPKVKVGGLDLKRNVTAEQKEELQAYLKKHKIGGITFLAVPQRYYNYGEFASQVLGYAVNDGESLKGIYGLEAYYNSVLSGTDGYRYAEVDARTEGVLPYSAPVVESPINGKSITLNIDVNIQRIAEDACKQAYERYNPKDGVCCIVMKPDTGAILAMVSIPDYDLNEPYAIPYGMNESMWSSMTDEDQVDYLMQNVWRNRCISDTYEPGSTFKALTTAISLEENLTNEEEMFSDAPIAVSDVDTISCWAQKKGYNHGTESLTEAFQQSCNPIFVQLAYRIGVDKYYDYVHAFGFYETTGIDLPAEETGIFHTNPSSIDMACLSFGESATVTPIQLLNSYCAIINGGDLMVPHVVKYISDSDGNIVDEIEPEVIRTIFSDDTCTRVRALMEKVVKDGTGKKGQVPGYSVAGKTSTSTIEVGEDRGSHVLSFSCYAPSYDPQIAVLVVLNKPEDNSVGSSAAAETSAKVVEGTLTYLGVPRIFSEDEYDEMTKKFYVQPVAGMEASKASSTIGQNGITAIYGTPDMTTDTIVGFTYPGTSDTLYDTGLVIMYPEDVTDEQMLHTTVPNLKGKSAVECMQALSNMNLNCNISATSNIKGVCVSQSHEPGSTTLAGEIITVELVESPEVTLAVADPDEELNEDGVTKITSTNTSEENEETPSEG
ncbi:MAG: PASTA domain-containing protein, partial [Clostridiales bacterium]|nr:PASTA domain-containing protein [Clostridiales bacterium]